MEIIRPTSSAIPAASQDSIISQNHGADTQAVLDLEDLYCILQTSPNNSAVACELARRLEKSGRIEEAYKIMKSVVKIDSCFETVAALAQLEYQLDIMDEAFVHLQQAIMIADEDAPALFDVFKTLGNIFVRNGDYDSAEDCYNKAYRLNPESDVLHVNLGTLGIQRQDWDSALERFRSALAINSQNDKAWVGVAIGHRMKSDFELAWGNIEAALEYNPLNETALGLALEWSTVDAKEFRALELIRKFIMAGGWNEKLSVAFAWLAWRHGEAFLAELELERVLAVNPSCEQALNLRHQLRIGN